MEKTSHEPGTPSWVDLGTPDPPGGAAFYTSLFGWEVFDAGPDAGGYCMCYLRDKAVAGLGPQQQPDVPPHWTSYISVADVDATTKAVRDAGGEVFMEPLDVFDSGRMAVFADPTGAPFAVWQPTKHIGAELVSEPGAFTWSELTTRDTATAKAFYQAVFGWQPVDTPSPDYPYTMWNLCDRPVAGMIAMDVIWPSEIWQIFIIYFSVS